MTRGHVYMIMMAFVITYFVLAEVLFRRALSKYKKSKWRKFYPERSNYYEWAFLIALVVYTATGVIIGMINTWNDPI